jgi:hypothetical protein
VTSSARAQNRRLEYAPPRLQRLGPLAELTQGSTGTFKDVVDKMKPESPDSPTPS